MPDEHSAYHAYHEDAMILKAEDEAARTNWPEALRAWTKTKSRELPIEEICETLAAYDQLRDKCARLEAQLSGISGKLEEARRLLADTCCLSSFGVAGIFPSNEWFERRDAFLKGGSK